MSSELECRYQDVCERIEKAACRSGRKKEDITLVAVTKRVAVPVIKEAIAMGMTEFGENYLQEGREKVATIGRSVTWHFIGHLQKNKASAALESFDFVQGVDSVELAARLDRAAEKSGRVLDILLQIHYGDELSKHGFRTFELPAAMEKICLLQHIHVKGLMSIPPFYQDPEMNRANFADMRKQARSLPGFPHSERICLSMGMTDDFEIAIEEGSTMVRIGRALFGERK